MFILAHQVHDIFEQFLPSVPKQNSIDQVLIYAEKIHITVNSLSNYTVSPNITFHLINFSCRQYRKVCFKTNLYF